MLELIFGIVIIFGILYSLQLMIITDVQLNKLSTKVTSYQLHPISILKPLKGVDDNLEDNLSSFFTLDYPEYEILFGINSHDDPAIAVIKKLMKRFPKITAKLIVGSSGNYLNPKINNLNNIVFHTNYEYLLISDSNIKVDPDYLRNNIKLMALPNAGLVTSTIKGSGAKNLGSIFENIHLNTFVAGSVFLISNVFGFPIVIGKSMLIKKEVLNKINGFKAFADYLAEDQLIGKEVKKAGYKIYHSSNIINNVNIQWSIKRFLNRHIRWALIRKKLNIFHYTAEILANPIMVAFLYMIIHFNYKSMAIFFVISTIKTIFDNHMLNSFNADGKWYHRLLIPVKDIIIGLIWFIPFVNNKIEWRGNTFFISKGTHLKPAKFI